MDDPRHVLLSASEVMARYGWGKTKGYQNLKDRELVPPPVMTHPDRWRLDHLLAWEEKRMALAEAALEALVAPDREPTTVTDLAADGYIERTRVGRRNQYRVREDMPLRRQGFQDSDVRTLLTLLR